MYGDDAATVSGAKSRIGSYGSFVASPGWIAKLGLAASSV
jgi:hypothetical protein